MIRMRKVARSKDIEVWMEEAQIWGQPEPDIDLYYGDERRLFAYIDTETMEFKVFIDKLEAMGLKLKVIEGDEV